MSFADPWKKQDRANISEPSCTNTRSESPIPENAADREDSAVVSAVASLEFEDNFDAHQPQLLNPREPQDNRLPDSDNYLATLEKRLHRLKNNPTVLQQLAERREACMHSLLVGNTNLRSEAELELEEPVNNSELLRFIRPEQALSQAEIVQLVQHDHLQLDADEHEETREGEESGTESSTSR